MLGYVLAHNKEERAEAYSKRSEPGSSPPPSTRRPQEESPRTPSKPSSRSAGGLLLSLLLLPSAVAIPGELSVRALRELQRQAVANSVAGQGQQTLQPSAPLPQGVIASDPATIFTFGPNCAWNFHSTPDDLGPIAPEPNIRYKLSTLPLQPGDTTVYRVTGKFPLVRYFSFQSYTVPTYQPISSIKDFQFVAKTGQNPFHDPSTEQQQSGTYELYVTASGKEGYVNELRGALTPEELNSVDKAAGFKTMLLFLRLYAQDPVTAKMNKDLINFGFVEPPVVEYRVGNQGPWKVMPSCSDEMATEATATYNGILTTPQFYLPVRQFPINCPFANQSAVNENFFLFKNGDNKMLDTYVGFKNQDTSYICWCDFTRRITEEFVVVVQGKLPLTPYGLFKDTRIADRQKYESRYISFHAVDFAPPIPSLSAIYDSEIIDFYAHREQAQRGDQWDGRYRIVGSRNKEVADACGILGGGDRESMHLAFKRADNLIPDQVDELSAPGIIYRDILPRIIELGEPGHSTTDVNQQCKGTQCRDPAFYKSVMGDAYPTVTVYKCNLKTKVATKLTS